MTATLVRHAQTGEFAGLDDVLAAVVIAGHETDRFWQRPEPFGHELFFPLAGTRNGAAALAKEADLKTSRVDAFWAKLWLRMSDQENAVEPAKGEVTKTAIEQMVGRPSCQCVASQSITLATPGTACLRWPKTMVGMPQR